MHHPLPCPAAAARAFTARADFNRLGPIVWRPRPERGRVMRDRHPPRLRRRLGGPMRLARLAALDTLALALLVAPLVATAQPPTKVAHIGVLWGGDTPFA